jgi:hypothetical protein
LEEKTEEKQEKTLTKNISFHEKVCVKTIPSITKSSSETSETSEESSESIEIAPQKKNKPKENLKRTPTQLLMGTVGKIIGLLFGSLLVSLKKDMRNSSGKRWKTGLFGCLIDSSTLITGLVPCILGIKVATILGEPFGTILCCGGVASMRTKFRMLFDIKGSALSGF